MLVACSPADGSLDDDAAGTPDDGAGDEQGTGSEEAGAIAVLTRVTAPTGNVFYLHLLAELSPGTALDYAQAIEFPSASISANGGFLYLTNGEDLTITKYEVTDELQLEQLGRLSLQGTGAQAPAATQWDDAGNPYIVDSASLQVIRFDPEEMTLVDATAIPSQFAEREGLPVVITGSGGVALGERMWFNWSWVNYILPRAVMEVALAYVPLDGPPNFSSPILDERCPFSGGFPFVGPEGYLYTVGLTFLDAEAGEISGSCVLRLAPDADSFDPEYQIDLLAATDASFIGGTWPLADGSKLIVQYLAADGPQPASLAEYYATPEYRTALVDLATGEALELDVPRSVAGNWLGLSLDGDHFVQILAEAFDNAALVRVDPDGAVQTMVEAGSGADFRALERVR